MKVTMVLSCVAMIITVTIAPAVALPAAMLGAVIAAEVAMRFAMLAPTRVRGMNVAMLPIEVAVVSAVASARLRLAVPRRARLALVVLHARLRVLHTRLGALISLLCAAFETPLHSRRTLAAIGGSRADTPIPISLAIRILFLRQRRTGKRTRK